MPRFSLLAATVMLCTFTTVAAAQHAATPDQPAHAAMSPPDARELLHFPPELQSHTLRNMRDHMEALDGILQAVAAGDFASASRVAAERIGLDSPSAAGCKQTDAVPTGSVSNAKPAAPGSMNEMMALHMPKAMRAMGLAFHTSGSEFAVVAAQAATTHDTSAVVGALSRVTQNCVACHSAYRLQ